MKLILATILAFCSFLAQASTYAYPLNTVQNYAVIGAFSDAVDFTVPAFGTYTLTLTPTNRIVACSGRGCRPKGSILTSITAAQLQTAGGAAVADVAGAVSVYLTPGDYVLRITGTGMGTGAYVGQGGYAVTVQGPPVVQVLDCEWYDERNIPRQAGCLNP